jgi:hypothetical protein
MLVVGDRDGDRDVEGVYQGGCLMMDEKVGGDEKD